MPAELDRTYLRRLRLLGFAEATSTLVLFGVAMPLKYLADMPMAVTVVGALHGLLFVALVTAFVVAIEKVPLSKQLAAWGVVAAIFPFGPFVVDRKLARL